MQKEWRRYSKPKHTHNYISRAHKIHRHRARKEDKHYNNENVPVGKQWDYGGFSHIAFKPPTIGDIHDMLTEWKTVSNFIC